MLYKLTLSPTPLPNRVRQAKVRDVTGVPPGLWPCIQGLCEGKAHWPLFLYGPVGTGKSCAAMCLSDRVAGAEFWTMPDFVTAFQEVKAGRKDYYHLGQGRDLHLGGLVGSHRETTIACVGRCGSP